MGRVEGVIDDGADRCAVGGWCSPSAWRVRLELRGGLTSGQSPSNGRTYDGSHADHILLNCQEHVILARMVVYDTMRWAVVGFTWLSAMRSMASLATCSLLRTLS